jgi:2-polyprenyl-6-hydroxyphenyl methylase / 3-demethylubiquinone-9 3-methyltransferase
MRCFFDKYGNNTMINVDAREVGKFSNLASRWWDPAGEFKTLHDINPLRLDYIEKHCALDGRQVLDVGCGGGLLSEGMAARGAHVTGIDMSTASLNVARLHLFESELHVNYLETRVEAFAEAHPASFDVVTCMEMLEHVPDPVSVIHACARLLKPGGHAFFSTLNRNPKSFLFAIVAAEYVLGLLPRGTHEYARFIRPAELSAWLRETPLKLINISGLSYNPLLRHYALGADVSVNYLLCARRALLDESSDRRSM